MAVTRAKKNGVWRRIADKVPIDDTLTKKGYAADAAAVGDALAKVGGTADAVQYTPQTLTEEQQMQARANMGLYFKETVPAEGELVYDYVYTGWWDVASTDTLAQGNGIAGSSYVIEVEGARYECKGYRDAQDIPNAGVMGTAYLGNFGLVGVEHENSNANCPVCFYHKVNDGAAEDFAVAIDPDFTPSMGTEIKVYTATDEMVDKYHTIPEEYIPDTIARKLDIPESGSGGITEETDPTVQSWAKTAVPAEVGQYFRVSAVDENGNVTAVEAVDAPRGSGASENDNDWELINTVTFNEEGITSFVIDTDQDGNPFELSDMRMQSDYLASLGGTSTSSARTSFFMNGKELNYSMGNLSSAMRRWGAFAFVNNGRIWYGHSDFANNTLANIDLTIRPMQDNNGELLNDNSIKSVGITINNPGEEYFAVGYIITLWGRRKK